jgi:hypothetical protein
MGIGAGPTDGDSDDEMSESISELPSISAGTPKLSRKQVGGEVASWAEFSSIFVLCLFQLSKCCSFA